MAERNLVYIAGALLIGMILLGAFVLMNRDERGAAETTATAQRERRLVYATAGDINMLALIQNVIEPEYKKRDPSLIISSIHTGPGESGSRLIFEKIKAAKDVGKSCWDVDVAVVHQIFMSWAMRENILLPYAKNVSTWKYVTSEHAKNALGTPIEGYAIPLFHSQIAIAYNTKYVPNPPKSYAELVEWVKKNPGKFGYNGVKGGMSGVGFVVGWVYWKTGEYERLTKGPYSNDTRAKIEEALRELREFNRHVKITAGNVGTLDMLAREEIWMGPVWVDMFYTWMNEGKIPEHIRLYIPEPGLPGQPMYLVIPAKACNKEDAMKLIEFITSPEAQAKIIVEKYNWYPGIDGSYVMNHVSEKAKNRLFGDIKPETLRALGRSFPLSQYLTDITSMYERVVG